MHLDTKKERTTAGVKKEMITVTMATQTEIATAEITIKEEIIRTRMTMVRGISLQQEEGPIGTRDMVVGMGTDRSHGLETDCWSHHSDRKGNLIVVMTEKSKFQIRFLRQKC